MFSFAPGALLWHREYSVEDESVGPHGVSPPRRRKIMLEYTYKGERVKCAWAAEAVVFCRHLQGHNTEVKNLNKM